MQLLLSAKYIVLILLVIHLLDVDLHQLVRFDIGATIQCTL